MPHVISTVSAVLQGAGIVSFVIHNVYAHHITVAETVVVDTGQSDLVYFSGQADALHAVYRFIVLH